MTADFDFAARTLRTSTRYLTHTGDGPVLDTDYGPFPVDVGVEVTRAKHENRIVVLTIDARNFITNIRVLDRAKPVCGCCGGHGMHEVRAGVTRGPDDIDGECTNCEGIGRSVFVSRRNACRGYRELAKATR